LDSEKPFVPSSGGTKYGAPGPTPRPFGVVKERDIRMLQHPKSLTTEWRGNRRFILYYPLLHKSRGKFALFPFSPIFQT